MSYTIGIDSTRTASPIRIGRRRIMTRMVATSEAMQTAHQT